jgi:hypothetical protein
MNNHEHSPLQFPRLRKKHPQEWKLVSLRECSTPENMQLIDEPQKAADYWRAHITTHPHFNPEVECLVALMLNVRKRIKGHHFVSVGSLDSILVHPREVFRVAIIAAAASIVVMHNLCAAAHKLCYVALRVMCSRSSVALTSRPVLQRKECCATN